MKQESGGGVSMSTLLKEGSTTSVDKTMAKRIDLFRNPCDIYVSSNMYYIGYTEFQKVDTLSKIYTAQFLAAIAALYVTMSVGPSVGRSVGR